MFPDLRTRRVPQVWNVSILGVIASLPATAGINFLPYSKATAGGGMMIIGAMIAGAIAASRSYWCDGAV